MYNYEWQESPVYHQDIDGETKYGYSLGLLRRSVIGGGRGSDSVCGSRCVSCYVFSAPNDSGASTRGCRKRSILGRLGMVKIHILLDIISGKNPQYIMNILMEKLSMAHLLVYFVVHFPVEIGMPVLLVVHVACIAPISRLISLLSLLVGVFMLFYVFKI